jgi:hypothetical protein
LPLT